LTLAGTCTTVCICFIVTAIQYNNSTLLEALVALLTSHFPAGCLLLSSFSDWIAITSFHHFTSLFFFHERYCFVWTKFHIALSNFHFKPNISLVMSFSLQSRISVHQSANQRGSYVPSHIVEAAERRRERQQLQIISKAKATTQVQVSLPSPKVEFVTPPRQIRRPTARLLIDSPLPRREIFQDPVLHQRFIDTESPPNLDRYSNQKPRPKTQAEVVNTNDGAPSTPTPKTSTTSTSISDPNLVVVDGIQTRKRRAEDTEIDLAAAQIGVTDTSTPIITLRQGETVPSEESGQQANVSASLCYLHACPY
jgi:hypothetical protein